MGARKTAALLAALALVAGCGGAESASGSSGSSVLIENRLEPLTPGGAPTTTSAGTTTRPAGPTAASTTTVTPAPTEPAVPTPSDAQAVSFYRRLVLVEPSFASKTPESQVSRARNVCATILAGATEAQLLESVLDRFSTPTVPRLTTSQGAVVLGIIRSGGWCG